GLGGSAGRLVRIARRFLRRTGRLFGRWLAGRGFVPVLGWLVRIAGRLVRVTGWFFRLTGRLFRWRLSGGRFPLRGLGRHRRLGRLRGPVGVTSASHPL